MKNKRATSKSAADTIAIPRSEIVIYWIIALISLAGLADATYLAVQALTGETMVCGGSPDCFKVLGSPYARIGGVPLALVGAVAYFSVFSFASLAAFGFAVAADLKQDVNRSDYGEDFRLRKLEVHRLAKQIGDE